MMWKYSLFLINIALFLQAHPEEWFTANEIAAATNMVPRTVRATLHRLAVQRYVDRLPSTTPYRFRWEKRQSKFNKEGIRHMNETARALRGSPKGTLPPNVPLPRRKPRSAA